MYTVYTIPGSCSTGIVILLEKLQCEYTAVKRDEVPDYRELVPTNQVPALKTPEGEIITEGGAIALYLLEQHDSAMMPDDPSGKAQFLRWLFFDYATLHPAYGKMFAVKFKVDISEEHRTRILQQLAGSVAELWTILNKELAGKRFITGDTPTIVDYLAAIYSSWGNNFPDIPIALGDNVKRMIDEVSALPEFQAGYEREKITFRKAP